MTTQTVETVLRALFAHGAYDEDATISMSLVIELADEAGINLHPCYECHTYDGHTAECILARCRHCGNNPCTCDRNYERRADR